MHSPKPLTLLTLLFFGGWEPPSRPARAAPRDFLSRHRGPPYPRTGNLWGCGAWTELHGRMGLLPRHRAHPTSARKHSAALLSGGCIPIL